MLLMATGNFVTPTVCGRFLLQFRDLEKQNIQISVRYRQNVVMHFVRKNFEMVVAAGYPSELRLFLKKCGVPDADKFAGTPMHC